MPHRVNAGIMADGWYTIYYIKAALKNHIINDLTRTDRLNIFATRCSY